MLRRPNVKGASLKFRRQSPGLMPAFRSYKSGLNAGILAPQPEIRAVKSAAEPVLEDLAILKFWSAAVLF
jgi:hypothetical protein